MAFTAENKKAQEYFRKNKPTKGVGVYIYGKHALKEALAHKPGAVKKVFLSPNLEDSELRELLKKTGIKIGELRDEKKELPGSASHQGVIALVEAEKLTVRYDEFVQGLVPNADTTLVLLDEIQDPHNVGAVIRVAAAFGIAGVLIPPHNQAPITGAVVKVSAGMAFRIPLVQIGNVNTTLRDLKERGFWIYGLLGGEGNSIYQEKFDAPSVFVLGNESEGIRAKTREACDILLSIPMHPQCESLNVAAAAAVTFYEWSRHHLNALRARH